MAAPGRFTHRWPACPKSNQKRVLHPGQMLHPVPVDGRLLALSAKHSDQIGTRGPVEPLDQVLGPTHAELTYLISGDPSQVL